MTLSSEGIELNYKPKLPRGRELGIGIIGAGDIVVNAHLPAYQLAGFRIVGIYDRNRSRAAEAAERFGIAKIYDSLDQLLRDRDVHVVDVAVPANYQLDIVRQVAQSGKHLLCQKPLAESYQEAAEIVDLCASAGIKAASNQQMRWSPGIGASRDLIKRNLIGTPLQATIQVNVLTPWEIWPWIAELERLEVMYHSIHYLDSIRSAMGMVPEYIYADGARYPGQKVIGETRTMIHIKFPGDARGLIHDNHNNAMPEDDWYASFRFEGTDGIVKGTNGALYNYPHGQGDTVSYYSNQLEPGRLFSPSLEGLWFPHAFMGTMGELLSAIEDNREPENSVQDNLITMQMMFASYRSMEENRPVYLQEIAQSER
ncbi:Gfo/Idh/MocA family protein [Paenibacillus nasutitermitis]|uniref:Oxidoreductase n=1 Tax=Paenibacillus nasutitermitis TaxID=1652958 RepID=A0A916YXQ1_9BACL|nr:Gfo/Idh/MocA family oxidoreductase [Paenibacillus nasutitermitis]GGD66565.1 oxidoreductase [Paenibacillus nasutitermitis]